MHEVGQTNSVGPISDEGSYRRNGKEGLHRGKEGGHTVGSWGNAL